MKMMKNFSPIEKILVAAIAFVVLATVAFFVVRAIRDSDDAQDQNSTVMEGNGGASDDSNSKSNSSDYMEGSVEYNGHHYKIVNDTVGWNEAERECERIGGHLLTITTSDEQSFIEQLVDKEGVKKHYWLGGTDEDSEGNWQWVTGENWNYNNWCSGQPNNKTKDGSGEGQNYLEMQMCGEEKDPLYKWSDTYEDGISPGYEDAPDYNTTEYFGYICEWEN